MLARLYSIGWLLLMALIPGAALGQSTPEPQALIDQWLRAQHDQIRALAFIELRQEATWTVDGPYGAQSTRWTAHLSAVPGEGLTDYEVESVDVNGRDVPPEHWRQMAQRRFRMLGPALRPHVQGLPRATRLLRSLRPVSSARLDTTTAVPTWRIDAVTRAPHPRLDRVTLWFDQSTDRLHRSRLLMRLHPTGPPAIVTTRYRPVDGLDVPTHRRIEGSARTQRRLRTFTVLFTYEATFGEYVIEYRDDR